jgi:hypothetical protein
MHGSDVGFMVIILSVPRDNLTYDLIAVKFNYYTIYANRNLDSGHGAVKEKR